MKKVFLVFFLFEVFCNSAIAQQQRFPMIDAINGCTDIIENKKHPDVKDVPDDRVFEAIAWCTKEFYKTNGNTPDSPVVKNFYTLLDEIVEDYVSKKITLKKAKAEMIRAWSITIDADNARQAAAKNVPQPQPQPQVMINPWERAHQILKGIDPASNQRYLDRQCYNWCTGQGVTVDQCAARCSR